MPGAVTERNKPKVLVERRRLLRFGVDLDRGDADVFRNSAAPDQNVDHGAPPVTSPW